MEVKNVEKKAITLKEAAEIYSLSLSWLHKRSAERSLGGLYKLGSKVILNVEEFDAWLRSHRVDGKVKRGSQN